MVEVKRGDPEAFKVLLMSCQYIVLEEVLYFINSGIEVPDLIQEANEGCINAIYNYENSIINLKNYLHGSIYRRLSNYVASNFSTVRYPVNVLDKINEIRTWLEGNCPNDDWELSVKNTTDALIRVTDRSDLIPGFYNEKSNDFGNVHINKVDIDLDNILFSDSNDPDYDLLLESLRYETLRSLYSLPDKEAEYLKLYFGINREKELTLEDIGAICNLTRERIRQVKEKALSRLSHPSRNKNLLDFIGLYSYVKYPLEYSCTHIYKSFYEDEDTIIEVIKNFVRPFRRVSELQGVVNQSKECRRLVRKFLEMNNEPVQMEDIKYYILEMYPEISQNIIHYSIKTTSGVINIKKGYYALREWGYIENTITYSEDYFDRIALIKYITDVLKEQTKPISETYLLSKIQGYLGKTLIDKEIKKLFKIIGRENSIIRTLDNKYYLLVEE